MRSQRIMKGDLVAVNPKCSGYEMWCDEELGSGLVIDTHQIKAYSSLWGREQQYVRVRWLEEGNMSNWNDVRDDFGEWSLKIIARAKRA